LAYSQKVMVLGMLLLLGLQLESDGAAGFNRSSVHMHICAAELSMLDVSAV
jgi:hypothetical protein